jgi:excisionase family DNA binding protein
MAVSDHGRRAPLDVEQAAAYLGVTPRKVRRLREQRRLPTLKLGRDVRFDPDDLDAYLKQCREPPAEDWNWES